MALPQVGYNYQQADQDNLIWPRSQCHRRVDPEAIRLEVVMACFGGMIPGEPVNLNDEEISDDAAE